MSEASTPKKDPEVEVDEADETEDCAKLFEQYQERFNRAFAISQKLFITERAQRQTLKFYQRRNNALLDILTRVEDTPSEEFGAADATRIANLIDLNPKLKDSLEPLLHLDDASATVKASYPVSMLLHELIPELISDDLDIIETNPQESESWVRRNIPNLVISKFSPIELKPTGAREVYEELTSKRRRRAKDDFRL